MLSIIEFPIPINYVWINHVNHSDLRFSVTSWLKNCDISIPAFWHSSTFRSWIHHSAQTDLIFEIYQSDLDQSTNKNKVYFLRCSNWVPEVDFIVQQIWSLYWVILHNFWHGCKKIYCCLLVYYPACSRCYSTWKRFIQLCKFLIHFTKVIFPSGSGFGLKNVGMTIRQ